ncbi:hypothetical protein TYRP_023444 [Tyrophagus putrescentiae]|nr:hypothetical protein TYRP_023444 [Tyrophagus putrescentiae]
MTGHLLDPYTFLNFRPRTARPSNSSSFSFFQNGPINKGERRAGPVQLKDVHRIRASLQQGPGHVQRLLGPNRPPISTEVEAVQEDDALCPAGQKEISVGKKRRKFFSAVRRQREDSSVQRRAAKVEPPPPHKRPIKVHRVGGDVVPNGPVQFNLRVDALSLVRQVDGPVGPPWFSTRTSYW